jgi:outer membrane protein assembly factor BamD
MIVGTFSRDLAAFSRWFNRGLMKKFVLVLPLLFLLLSCGGKKVATNAPANEIYEPDRVLFDRAMRDLKKNKFVVGRLTLQTLINTYPDSEFLPRAKYAMAESFFKENSNSALSQAENEFKDYITFFPTSDLADDAQLKIAMTHIRRVEKHDRDNTQARLAEVELKSMIETYPDSDLLDEAKRDLRAIQEVLADGVYSVGNFYMLHRNYAAAVSRYKEVMTKYPDYSKSPDALFGLAEALRHAGNEPEAAIYYARIVIEHPISARVSDAKQHLTALNQPIPEPNPVALARAQQTLHDDKSILGKMFGMFKSRPAVPTETTAKSSADEETSTADEGLGPVRGGTTAASGGTSTNTNNNSGGTFNIDPKVVDKPPQPAKKFR